MSGGPERKSSGIDPSFAELPTCVMGLLSPRGRQRQHAGRCRLHALGLSFYSSVEADFRRLARTAKGEIDP